MTTQTGFKQDVQGSWIEKDPAAILIYTLDWSDWISSGDQLSNCTFATSTISGDPTPITILDTSFVAQSSYALANISGGSAGNTYTITNTIRTQNGATDVRRFKLKVQQRYV